MAIYNINNALLSVVYDRFGAELDSAYDADGNKIYSKRTLTGISVSYSGGTVSSGTTLDQLTGIEVTAIYSDGTTETVTDYTLSGTLTAGQDNTITVTYQEKTATFTVTVEAVVAHNATRTYSAGDVALTVADDVDEQIVSVDDGTMAFVVYPDFPSFENPYLECPSSKFPITISAGGIFKNQLLNGYLNFSGSDKYFCAAHCITDGPILKGDGKGNVNGSFDYPGALNGSGWIYWLSNGSSMYGTIFTCSKKTVIDKLYGVHLTGTDYEDLSTYGARMAEYMGELDLIPGQNFAGRSTGGVVTVYKNGTAIGTNADLRTLTVKAGDVLKCNGGSIVFRVGVNATNQITEVKYVAVGDSLTDSGINATYKYHAIIKDKIGLKSVPVLGRGSSGYKKMYDSGLSFWQRIACIPHDADIVTIFGSVNDWNDGITVSNSVDVTGNVTDNISTGQASYAAFVNAAIDMAKKQAPLSRIAIATELYYGGDKYETYRLNKLKEIGLDRNVHVYDLYNDTYEGTGYPDGTNPYCNTYEGMGLNFQQAADTDFYNAYHSVGYHPNNDYNMQWLAPIFANIICKELGLSTSLLPDDLRIDT